MRGQLSWQDQSWPGAVGQLDVDENSLGLIVVDMQYGCADPERSFSRPIKERRPEIYEAWVRRITDLVVPNTQRLLSWFRANGRPVIYTRVGSLLPDAEDQHVKRRLAWHRTSQDEPPARCPVGSPDYEILAEVAPRPDELVIDKNASGAFNSSGIDYALQQLGLRTLVVTGVSTFACVDNTARDAADRGYNAVIVEDACAGAPGNEAAHDATLWTFARYFGAVKTTRQLVSELDRLIGAPAVPARPGRA